MALNYHFWCGWTCFKFINIFKRHIKGDILLCLPSPELLALVLGEIRIIWILIKPFNFKYMGEKILIWEKQKIKRCFYLPGVISRCFIHFVSWLHQVNCKSNIVNLQVGNNINAAISYYKLKFWIKTTYFWHWLMNQ